VIKLGRVEISAPFCQAGLAGYSDRAMRTVARRRGCSYALTEALLDVILCSGGQGLRKSIDISDEDHPVAGQIMGSDAETMVKAATLLAGRGGAGYDVVDLNFACPVKKIKAKSRGGHMLRDVPRAVDILKAVRDALPPEVPTTVSMRRSFDDSPESAEMFEEVVAAAWANGYAAIRVHARTVEQKYQGRAWWPFLRKFRAQHPGRIIFGSGDVFTAEDAVRMVRETGVDVAWIARGAIGNPWIFDHAARILSGEDPATLLPPSIEQQRAALEEHFSLAMDIHGEQVAGRRMRKMGIKYSRFHPHHLDVKKAFIEVHSLTDWQRVLDEHYGGGGAGVWPAKDAVDEVNEGTGAEGCEVAGGTA
jgi:tRNA-dihydrouridine synthase B